MYRFRKGEIHFGDHHYIRNSEITSVDNFTYPLTNRIAEKILKITNNQVPFEEPGNE